MITKNDFLNFLNDYQEDVSNFLLSTNEKFIIVRGRKFIGKTSVIYRMFISDENNIIFYHTGCHPDKRQIATKQFLALLKETLQLYPNERILVLLDEYYDEAVIDFIFKEENLCGIYFTNSLDLSLDSAKIFNLYDAYEKEKEEFFGEFSGFLWQEKNIHEILSLFDGNNEKAESTIKKFQQLESLRTASTSTETKVKIGDMRTSYKIKFGENDDIFYSTQKL